MPFQSIMLSDHGNHGIKGTPQLFFDEVGDQEPEKGDLHLDHGVKGDAGTGIGLMVVDRIIRNHKGKIEILTRPGAGSLFRTIFRI